MYNYPGSAPYGRPPPGMGSFPGAPAGAPPGMGPAPGMGAPGAPGVGAPPGMQQMDVGQGGPPGRFPPNFQPPVNMPNINFNAPVIRLGTSGPAKSAGPMGGEFGRRDGNTERTGRMGLGAQDSRRGGADTAVAPLLPPTKDEVARTIFIGGIVDGTSSDDHIERFLRAAGSLRRWTRATDADNKPCRFGFAEYENPESLATAIEVLKDVEVPVKSQLSSSDKAKSDDEKDEEEPVEKNKLLVFVDDATTEYVSAYQQSRGGGDDQGNRLTAAREAIAAVLAELLNPSAHAANNALSSTIDGESKGQNGEANGDAEVVTIPLSADDELADIPAEMRETVAKEIAAFRERSNRRDLERMKREEEIEAQDRQRNTSPGLGGGANSIPVGPRDRSVPNAPLGPKGFSGSQMPQDYQKNVSFVNGSKAPVFEEEDDTDADDEELERRKKTKKDEEQEHDYLNQERRWLNRERSRTAAIEREKTRDREEDDRRATLKEKDARRMREFNDDDEATRKHMEYYVDRSQWIRNRASARSREANLDDIDRSNEEREAARERAQQDQARGMADDFLNRQAMELDAKLPAPVPQQPQPKLEPQKFKLSLGAAAQKAQQSQAHQNRRTAADVEGLLEDEEPDEGKTKRTLVPIQFDPAEARTMSHEERQQAARSLAAEIPQDKDGLWAWPVKWEFVDDTVITDQLKPFVEKKIVELLGVQEQMLVDLVETHVRAKGGPQALIEQLEGALDDDAELLVKKLWRMIIFYSESEKRGIAA